MAHVQTGHGIRSFAPIVVFLEIRVRDDAPYVAAFDNAHAFIQRKLPLAIKLSITKDPDAEGDISQFGALTTALSATIGTGNIVGVATAILAGGPGAVLWMWLTGVFGIATKYSETYAAVKYRVKDHEGKMLGGAMYAWERAFKRSDGTTPWWAKLGAVLFCVFAVIATLGTGSAVQSAAMTGIIESSFPDLPAWGIGLVIAVSVALVIFGGVRSISKVCEKLEHFGLARRERKLRGDRGAARLERLVGHGMRDGDLLNRLHARNGSRNAKRAREVHDIRHERDGRHRHEHRSVDGP